MVELDKRPLRQRIRDAANNGYAVKLSTADTKELDSLLERIETDLEDLVHKVDSGAVSITGHPAATIIPIASADAEVW